LIAAGLLMLAGRVDLLAVENQLNNRPRLVLNDRAPAELFGALLASKNRPRCDVD
jgi:IS30 family transposase